MLAEKLKALEALHPKKIDLTLDRVLGLLEKLGNPHRRLPPVIHVAGTNGKGSTIAFMRAMLEAAGQHVHVYTSPHLIKFNERIRLAGALVDDATLIHVFDEIETLNAGAPITFFEITTVAAFMLFARVPADVLLLEVGLGGRLDATNVITPAVSVITRISMDHMEFLGDTLEKIAAEKAGIMKPGVPCVMGYQADENVKAVFRARAAEVGSELIEYGKDFTTQELPDGFIYRADDQTGRRVDEIKYPLPALLGAHQILNAAAAITALHIFSNLMPHTPYLTPECIAHAMHTVEWPGRLQRITSGPVYEEMLRTLGDRAAQVELWYDGAHNDSGAEALAEQCRRWKAEGAEIHLVLGMLKRKDASIFGKTLAESVASFICMPALSGEFSTAAELIDVLGKPVAAPTDWAGIFGSCVPGTPRRRIMLVCGSLYIAPNVMGCGG